ncbi:OLC1v1020753C2 [Oldenlandia corymbosa var. corymbosa]|uniref:OLC1v1020753C2 n=1 Tax=Oldenlandia corymbosa var. corymbosa TaxID=529605 RepID=A0AAV1BWI6_OLDCO|nr:OLC1v1020753C2 [Oldenlandia corymbosa var. corymbosa]
MNRKGLAILMRTKMRPLSPPATLNKLNQMEISPQESKPGVNSASDASVGTRREFEHVKEYMHSAISMNKTEILDATLSDFSEGYVGLSDESRRKLLLSLAREYDLDRMQVQELVKQYLGLELPAGGSAQDSGNEEELSLSAFYRIERNLRHALKPNYEILFERLNKHPGGLKFLSIIRADILSILGNENFASLRALDSYLKEKLTMWLSPANLELHNITWDDPASLLEKIVAYEAVHPISSLLDLKRRLGVGRRCFGYLHPAIPGEPLIFIEVALMKNVAETIQPGLSGINLGKFLIKRVIDVVKKDMPNICMFATLSPIPGYMQWLLSKLASAERSVSTFKENLLNPEEEKAILDASMEFNSGKSAMEVMQYLLTSKPYKWSKSPELISVLRTSLLRLCARYLLQEKKRGKALDSVANFHLQNGAMIGRLNWMADRSEKGLTQSGGIMVNYIYRVENIEENAQSYYSKGQIPASSEVSVFLKDH